MFGQPPEDPRIAAVRSMAIAVRQGLSGQAPAPGQPPLMSPQEALARQAGSAAAPILGDHMATPPTPAPGAKPLNPAKQARANGATPGKGFGQAVSALARQRAAAKTGITPQTGTEGEGTGAGLGRGTPQGPRRTGGIGGVLGNATGSSKKRYPRSASASVLG